MQEKPSTARIALKWGGILGLVLIVYSLVLFLTGTFGDSRLGWVSTVLSIGGLVLAMREFRTQNRGYMAYGEGVGVGTLTAAISGLLSALFTTFYTTIIDPNVMQQMIERVRVQYEERGMSDEQIDQAMGFVERMQSPGITFAIGVIGAALFGLLLSLIIAAIMRRKRDNPFD